MKTPHKFALAVFSAAILMPGIGRAELLLHEDFEGYTQGTALATTTTSGQTGTGLGLTGDWVLQGTDATWTIGSPLEGSNGLVVGAGSGDVKISHTVANWGTGVFYMSYLWHETAYSGHFYVSGGGGFAGAFGHAWATTWGINNSGNGIGYSPNQTYRVVLKIDNDAGTETMWADPVAETDGPVATKAETQGSGQTLIIRTAGTHGVIDDIMIGETFAEVNIAPPSLAPPAPDAVSPADTATNVLLDEPLQWTSISADSWDVYLWKTSEIEPGTPTAADLTVASYDTVGLDPVENYSWKVVADNTHGSTPSASTWTFSTSDGVIPMSPTDGATDVPLFTELEWSDIGATTWDVYLWKDTDTEPVTPSASGLLSPSYSPTVLDSQTTYNMKVDSIGSALGTTTSITWSFTTGDGATPLSPANNANGYPADGALQWAVDGATSWDVYLWKSTDTEPGSPTDTVTSPISFYAGLDASTEYSWKIVSNGSQGTATSNTLSFTTDDGLPGELVLYEEFDGYAAGSIIGQTGQGLGMTGDWTQPRTDGSYEIGAGLSGDNGLVITASARNDARVEHAIDGWGTGQFWMSYLYSEVSYGGHFYVSGGSGFNGGAGHEWWNGNFGLHNMSNPGFPYNKNEIYRLVVMWDFDAGTTKLWVDPTGNPLADGTPPAAQKVEVPEMTPALFMTSYGNVGTIDDIRIGTKFDVMTGVVPSGIAIPTLEAAINGANLDFSWNSTQGMRYDLVSSPDLATPIATWPVVDSNEAIPADPSGTNTLSVVRPGDDKYFYALVVSIAPPTVFFSSDFEADNGGMVFVDNSGGTGTIWEWGAPDSDNAVGSTVTESNGPSVNCWATGLGDFTATADNGYHNATTDASLRTPVIDLTAVTSATLNFAQAMDVAFDDTAVVNFLDADDGDAVLATETYLDGDFNSSLWETKTLAVPAAALGKNVRIEWRLTTSSSVDYIGWYIDDVQVIED